MVAPRYISTSTGEKIHEKAEAEIKQGWGSKLGTRAKKGMESLFHGEFKPNKIM